MRTIRILSLSAIAVVLLVSIFTRCTKKEATAEALVTVNEQPDYFLLRPEVEKAFGYAHAVKIGNDIKISEVHKSNP